MKIKEFDDVFYIAEFELKKERAKHSVCHFKASVKDEIADKYLSMIGKTISVMLDNNMPIFSGNNSRNQYRKNIYINIP